MARQTAKRKAIARSIAKAESADFIEILPKDDRRNPAFPPWCTRTYRNNRFYVMIEDGFNAQAKIIRAMVVPHNAGRDVFWKDLQDIKNQIFGEEATAAQYYPPASKLIDSVNVYWLYVGIEIPEGGK